MKLSTKVTLSIFFSCVFLGFSSNLQKITSAQLVEQIEESMSMMYGCDVLISQGDGTLEPKGGRVDRAEELKIFQKEKDISDDQMREVFKEIIKRDRNAVSVGKAVEYLSYYPDESVKVLLGNMIEKNDSEYFTGCVESYMRVMEYRNDKLINTVLNDKDRYSEKGRYAVYSAMIKAYKIQNDSTKHKILEFLKDELEHQLAAKKEVNNSILQYMAMIDRFLAFHDKEWAESAERLQILKHLCGYKTDSLVRPVAVYYTNSIAVLKAKLFANTQKNEFHDVVNGIEKRSVVTLSNRLLKGDDYPVAKQLPENEKKRSLMIYFTCFTAVALVGLSLLLLKRCR